MAENYQIPNNQAPEPTPTPGFGTTKQPTPNAEKQVRSKKGNGFLTTVSVILLILVTALGVRGIIQKNKLNKDISDIEAVIEAQQNEQVVVDNQEISLGIKKAFLDKQRDEQIFWSNVLVRFNEIARSSSAIRVSGFSGNEQGNISFSAQTTQDSSVPYIDTAQLIQRFKAATAFEGVFIPSISAAITEGGQDTLTYNVRVDYAKGESDSELIEESAIDESAPELPEEAEEEIDDETLDLAEELEEAAVSDEDEEDSESNDETNN